MKKMTVKIIALAMTMLLMFSLSLSVAAVEYDLSISNALVNTNMDSDDGSSVVASVGGSNTGGKPVGIFALKVRQGSDIASMGAFLVEKNGKSYILTHVVADGFVQQGSELTLMGMDGKNHQAVCLGVDPDYELAYLSADGMSGYEPLTFSKDSFSKAVTVVLSYSNNNYTAAKMLEYRTYDIGRLTQRSGTHYSVTDREVSLQWLGSPILPDKGSMEVQGICSFIQDDNDRMFMSLITFEKLKLDSSLALGAAGSEEGTPDPDDPDDPDNPDNPDNPDDPDDPDNPDDPDDPDDPEPGNKWILWIVPIVVAIACFFLFRKNKNKKKKTEEEPVVDVVVSDPPVVDNKVTTPIADWNLICTSGPLKGKVYPLNNKMIIGRSAQADIRFPENTPGISGLHCEITAFPNDVILQDLNSTYGTFFLGKKLNPGVSYTMSSGDSFTLAQQGGVTFKVEKAGRAGVKQHSLAVRSVDGKVYRAEGGDKLTFGRNSTNNVRLAQTESSVSGTHCVLYYEGDKLYLMDLGSTNGTFFSEKERLKPNRPYQVNKGNTFFLARQANSFVVIE